MSSPAGPRPRQGGVLPSPAVPAGASRRALRRSVLAWFERDGRRLEFRAGRSPDAWGVLVSEVMAQQTGIARVEERWPGFMAAFPSPAAMAAATPADAIRAWRGLGYNRRALGLHRAAVAIVAAGGAVPGDVAGLQALPGVGPYTARAVAAIAFGRPVGAVDVNVRRVVGRICAGDPGLMSPRDLQAAADSLVDPDRPGTWTHAVMDLGATLCSPARPVCPECPARRWCAAAAGERVVTMPGRTRRTPTVTFERTTRWLRGRIVDRLRDAPAGAPVPVEGPLGSHSAEAVAIALAGLARDGIIEIDGTGRAWLAGAVGP